jgi:hypothetical protein
MIRLFSSQGIEVINIVRKEDQVADLKVNYDAQHVLNSEAPNFFDKLSELIK